MCYTKRYQLYIHCRYVHLLSYHVLPTSSTSQTQFRFQVQPFDCILEDRITRIQTPALVLLSYLPRQR
jgi:hypothetical protein